MKYKKYQCKECGKKKTSYNKGRYCFACNRKCVVRDEILVKNAKQRIESARKELKVLRDPDKILMAIKKNERLIELQRKIISEIKNYVTNPIEEEEEDGYE